MTNPHRSAGRVLHGPAPADAPLVVVAAHGRGQSPDYLVEHLLGPVAARRGADDIAWILPAADDHSWYPLGFLAPLADNQPRLDHALEVLGELEDELRAIAALRVVWAGFSQGACLVAEHLARRPRRWGGIAVLTGGMIGPPDQALTIDGDLAGMPALFTNGDEDAWVPLWRTSATADAYRAAGADAQLIVVPGREHEIAPAEIDAVCALLTRVADAADAPASPASQRVTS